MPYTTQSLKKWIVTQIKNDLKFREEIEEYLLDHNLTYLDALSTKNWGFDSKFNFDQTFNQETETQFRLWWAKEGLESELSYKNITLPPNSKIYLFMHNYRDATVEIYIVLDQSLENIYSYFIRATES